MKEQNNKKDRVILALLAIIALLLTIEPSICTDAAPCLISIAMSSAAVVLSAIVVICRWNIRGAYSNSTNIIDIFLSVLIWGWTVQSLMHAI